jgi:CTP-dependent riboflavin kinase
VKKEMRKQYEIIKQVYRYLAAVGAGTGGGAWYINLNTYTEFVKQNLGLVDSEEMNVESDMQFGSINKRTKMSPTNP